MPLLRYHPENASLADLRAIYGELLGYLRPYAQHLMRGPSRLKPSERELIAAYVSGVISCRYRPGSHSLTTRGFGIGEFVLSSLMEDIDRAPVGDRLTPTLRYVRKLTETPGLISQADVYRAGWR